jgi:hypothetical protein
MKSDNLGLGVMIQMLGGNEETVNTLKGSVGKKITQVELIDNIIKIDFEQGGIEIYDNGQSCCESRFITTDDEVSDLVGKKFTSVELAEAPDIEYTYGQHDVQFVRVHAEDTVVVFETHNEHNGYYGGFWIVAREKK